MFNFYLLPILSWRQFSVPPPTKLSWFTHPELNKISVIVMYPAHFEKFYGSPDPLAIVADRFNETVVTQIIGYTGGQDSALKR